MYGSDAQRGLNPAFHGSPAPGSQYWLPWMEDRHRLAAFLLAIGLHGVLLALFLLPQRITPPVTPPVPIQTQIIDEPRVPPAPPPLKPVTFTPAPPQIIVPAALVAIPDPAVSSTSAQPMASAAVAVAAVPSAPMAPSEPVAPPRFDAAYLHNPAPEYPLQARRRHEEGAVLLRVEVSAEGGALQVLIEHTSGWRVLDEAALSAVRHWRFEPARQGRDAVAAWVLVPIEFGLRT